MIKDGMNSQPKDVSEVKQQELEPIDSDPLFKNTQVPEKASKDTLSLYERQQLLLGTIQASIVAIGTGAAIYVGVKQAAINQQLYDLHFTLAPEIAYDTDQKRLRIFNRGKENIWLWGTKYGTGPKSIEKEGRLISPAGFYYLLTANMEKEVREKVGTGGDIRVPFEVYFKDGRHRPYIVRIILFIQVTEGKMAVHAQTVSIDQMEW
jgi:hypothetical protein